MHGRVRMLCGTRLLAEGAPHAYKDVSEVVRACEGEGLTRTVARRRPVGVVER